MIYKSTVSYDRPHMQIRPSPWVPAPRLGTTETHQPLLHLPLSPQLLSKPKFCSVEKIKTIGSTYMAAAGLTVYLNLLRAKIIINTDILMIILALSRFKYTVYFNLLFSVNSVFSGPPCRRWTCFTATCAPWLSLPWH